MNKRFVLILSFVMVYTTIRAITTSEMVVQSFANRLSNWCVTKNYQGSEEIEDICNGKISFRASDDFIVTLANRYHKIPTGSYVLDDYLSCLKNAIKEGIRIDIVNVKDVTGKVDAIRKDLVYASCEFHTSGVIRTSSNAVFLVNLKDNKICGVQKYNEITTKSGESKIHVDLSDIEDEESFELNYNYSQHFPVGASLTGSWSWFMVGLDFGMTFEDDKVITDKMKITDLNNFERTRGTYTPKFYLTATPAVYLKYVSIGCGIGGLFMTGTEEEREHHSRQTLDDSGNISTTEGGTSSEVSATKVKFMLRPVVRGYIPLNDEWRISIGIGYDYIFGYKDKNGVNFSLGFNYRIEW